MNTLRPVTPLHLHTSWVDFTHATLRFAVTACSVPTSSFTAPPAARTAHTGLLPGLCVSLFLRGINVFCRTWLRSPRINSWTSYRALRARLCTRTNSYAALHTVGAELPPPLTCVTRTCHCTRHLPLSAHATYHSTAYYLALRHTPAGVIVGDTSLPASTAARRARGGVNLTFARVLRSASSTPLRSPTCRVSHIHPPPINATFHTLINLLIMGGERFVTNIWYCAPVNIHTPASRAYFYLLFTPLYSILEEDATATYTTRRTTRTTSTAYRPPHYPHPTAYHLHTTYHFGYVLESEIRTFTRTPRHSRAVSLRCTRALPHRAHLLLTYRRLIFTLHFPRAHTARTTAAPFLSYFAGALHTLPHCRTGCRLNLTASAYYFAAVATWHVCWNANQLY